MSLCIPAGGRNRAISSWDDEPEVRYRVNNTPVGRS
jgi:hypothetical protein